MLALPSERASFMEPINGSFMQRLPYHRATPRQYAIPAQNHSHHTSEQERGDLSYTDHLRRRKTPNGPVMYDFDTTPTDKTVHIPATKHVLLAPPEPPLDSPRALRHADVAIRTPSSLNSTSNLHAHSQQANATRGYKLCQGSYAPSWDFPGGLDSMLNQALPTHPSQRYYLQYGSSIPTVLPATMQTYLGPTAPAGPSLFGPYWPDGSFNPYRPAPVRDDRFYPQLSERGSLYRSRALSELNNYSHHTQPYSQLSHNSSGFDVGTENIYSTNNPMRQGVPAVQTNKTLQSYPQSQDSSLEQRNVGEPLFRGHAQQHCQGWLEPNVQSAQFTFRERTFAWAHRIYLQLLHDVHKTRKISPMQYRSVHTSQNSQKPLIFPRPPKGPSMAVSTSSSSGRWLYNDQQDRESFDMVQKPPVVDSEPSRPPTAIYSPCRREHCSSNRNWADLEERHPVRSFSHHQNAKQYDFRQASDPFGTLHPPALSNDIQHNALAALEIIEALCDEARQGWVDGMLLAGCLAYGLENYAKALHWYESVLRQDTSNVEAMSNLAATLLVLDRRQEALQFWAAAVRKRPSYFEAVEHLIGLLCGEHRTKEAIAIIESVERSLRQSPTAEPNFHHHSDTESDTKSRSSSINTAESFDAAHFDYGTDESQLQHPGVSDHSLTGFGSSGFAIPGNDNGRMLALIHAKGNMLYSIGDNQGAATAFEDAILVATGYRRHGIRGLMRRVLQACSYDLSHSESCREEDVNRPILLSPERALLTARRMFYPTGELPGFRYVVREAAQKAAVSTTSNSLLSLAKIYQDGLSNAGSANRLKSNAGTRDILALYYLSLSLQPSPSTANNVGILLASVQQTVPQRQPMDTTAQEILRIAGVVPGSGIALALAYYNFGLNLDKKHAHLYTNLGSLLKDIGQLEPAIGMYERAVACDPKFDIALANLANAVKDQGRIADAIAYYRRAVIANPQFAEAVCGLATALNSVCSWRGRGGVYADSGRRDLVHVNDDGLMYEGKLSTGWVSRVVQIVDKQLEDGKTWGIGALTHTTIEHICHQLALLPHCLDGTSVHCLQLTLQNWAGRPWEGSRIVRLIEKATQRIAWQWYQDRYIHHEAYPSSRYARPALPSMLSIPAAPTVLPFHTFTAPLSAKQIRQISQRNGLRISVSTLRSSWLPSTVYQPPPPPRPHLNVGYVSSDFNNHPLAHLMQSIFGMHNPGRVQAFCYATTKSDGSVHRLQIEREAPVFHDATVWSTEKLVNQIVMDGIHILVNLNGYTRGARNEVFAARPAPIHMSFMGFAGTLGAEWCDYIYADEISVPPTTLSPRRRNCDISDRLTPEVCAEDAENWMYSENLIYARDTFFCVDHKQSAPDAKLGPPFPTPHHLRDQAWECELDRRWKMRRELFPSLTQSAVVLGNFNQLYKIDPSIFRIYLKILQRVPNAILWLLRFPDLGEENLLSFARQWATPEVASRIVFTDVAPKGTHITRASVVDLFLDTPECNAHTTAADVLWSGTPILTWGKWKYKMCSRMAGSIVSSAFPEGRAGNEARRDLVVQSEMEYEEHAVELANGLRYPGANNRSGEQLGRARGRLLQLRRMLWEGRWTSRLFDTKRWVGNVECAYWEAWRKWETGEGGDIWL